MRKNKELDLGKLSYLMGKKLSPNDPHYSSYIAAQNEARAKHQAHKIKMARYDELKAEGLSDLEIETQMIAEGTHSPGEVKGG